MMGGWKVRVSKTDSPYGVERGLSQTGTSLALWVEVNVCVRVCVHVILLPFKSTLNKQPHPTPNPNDCFWDNACGFGYG